MPNSVSPSALERIFGLRDLLDQLLSNPLAHDDGFVPLLQQCVHGIQHVCQHNPDLALASIQLCQDSPYAARHACNVAQLCELLLAQLGWDPVQRQSVVAAALTMNITVHQLQTQLSLQQAPLSDSQREQIRLHPQLGRDLLRDLGVADPVWLECVAQHHESPDGHGYPMHLAGDAIRFEARLIGVADSYCAMLSRRAWRIGLHSDSALTQALHSAAGSVDGKLTRLFGQTLGPYPPGALVRLIGGELAMVQSPGRSPATPLVMLLYSNRGEAIHLPLLRDSYELEYSIVEALDQQALPRPVSLTHVWGAAAQLGSNYSHNVTSHR